MFNIKTIWKNKWHILKGFWHSIFKTRYIESVAADRLEICATCPDLDEQGVKCMMPGTHPCCGKCGCSLAMKVRDLSSGCGNLDNPKWDPIKTEN